MDFGFGLPTRGDFGNRRDLEALARRGEELDFAYLCISDHIIIPKSLASIYPVWSKNSALFLRIVDSSL